MNVLILEHNKERERLIYQFIADRIRELSPESRVEIHNFDEAIDAAMQFPPDAILSHPVRDEQGACVMTALKLLFGCKVVCLSTEGLEYFDVPKLIDARIGSFDFGDRLVDYFFYWGEKPRDIFSRAMLKKGLVSSDDRVGVCGYVNYEKEVIRNYLSGNELARSIQRCAGEHKRNYCFVTTGFYDPDPVKEAIESSILSKDLSPEEYERLKTSIIAGNNYRHNYGLHYVDLIRRLAESYPEMGFIVKNHPIEIAEKKSLDIYDPLIGIGNVFLIQETLPMQAILDYADGLFHYGSTTAFEAYLYKVPSIFLYFHAEGEHDEGTFGKYIDTYDMDLGNFNIDEFYSNPPVFKKIPEIEKFLWEVFGYRDG
ncbi:MAG: hypothetical protein IJ873_00325, partial [Lachnospiraceae bacterium]|nr:hypothetical protein [Lachnospiraceae bacterium]